MAVSEQTPYIEYTANGTTTSFALEFDCDNQDHLIVLVDDVEPAVGTWSLNNGAVVFNIAPENSKKITIQRNTPFSRNTDFQSYNNSFRPQSVNGDFDRVWLKLQELGTADWILRQYVDKKDNELKAFLLAEIQAQGVALDQLEDYYNYLMQRLAQIAVDQGWDASFVVDGDKNQHQINFETNTNIEYILNRQLASSGFVLVGSFEDGATVTASRQAVWHKQSGKAYIRTLGDSIVVLAGSLPDSSWVEVGKSFGELDKAIISSDYVRPVFLRQTYNSVSGSNVIAVQDASKWKAGDRVLICGGGTQYFKKTFTVLGSPARSGNLYITADGFVIGAIAVLSTDTALQVAAKIRDTVFSGWTLTGSGADIIFTKNKAGLTVGASWSDINLVSIPFSETVNVDPTSHSLKLITGVNTGNNTLTLDSSVGFSEVSGLCYLEHSKTLQDASGGVKSIELAPGEYIFHNGLKFTQDFTGIYGSRSGDVKVYAIGGKDIPLIEFEKLSVGEAYYGAVASDFDIDMQNSRREGIVMRRLWDGSKASNVILDNVASTHVGFAVRRHSLSPVPATANDQSVVSQSVVLENVHSIIRSNSKGLPIYLEYMQEAVLNNVKGVYAADYNTLLGTSIGVQLEACRGVLLNASSASGANTGFKITSITGEVNGITLIGCTYETNENNLDIAGGNYEIYNVKNINPRCIGGGTGLFKIQRLTVGDIDCGDRNLNLYAAAKGVSATTLSSATVTNNGLGCSIKKVTTTAGIATANYKDGFDLVSQGSKVQVTNTAVNIENSGSKVAGFEYPFSASDTGMLLTVNKSGVVVTTKVVIGAIDSAGVGYRALRVAN